MISVSLLCGPVSLRINGLGKKVKNENISHRIPLFSSGSVYQYYLAEAIYLFILFIYLFFFFW